MSPLPHNYANEDNIICPEVPEVPTDQQKTLHAQKANYLRVAFQNVSNDYLAESRTMKYEISEIQITLC